jgi:hypothetical protein
MNIVEQEQTNHSRTDYNRTEQNRKNREQEGYSRTSTNNRTNHSRTEQNNRTKQSKTEQKRTEEKRKRTENQKEEQTLVCLSFFCFVFFFGGGVWSFILGLEMRFCTRLNPRIRKARPNNSFSHGKGQMGKEIQHQQKKVAKIGGKMAAEPSTLLNSAIMSMNEGRLSGNGCQQSSHSLRSEDGQSIRLSGSTGRCPSSTLEKRLERQELSHTTHHHN